MDTLKKLWPDAWGVRMEHVLRNSLYVLLERDGSTLPDLLRLYADKTFRREITKRVRNPVVRRFWLAEFEHYPDRYRIEVVAPIQNKLGALLSDPTLYRILVTPKVDLRLRSIMDEGGVLLVNLSKGQLGEDSAATLGGLLVSTLGLAALSRADAPECSRRPFFAYIDEFQSFTTLSFANMLAEVRKYGLGLTLAHQYLAQQGLMCAMPCLRTRARSSHFASARRTQRCWHASSSRRSARATRLYPPEPALRRSF